MTNSGMKSNEEGRIGMLDLTLLQVRVGLDLRVMQ